MKITDFADPAFSGIRSCITIGVFDGLHKGHISVIKKCVEIARQHKCASIVVSFNKNPKMFVGKENNTENLISKADFNQILEQVGVDYNCVIDFSRDLSKLSGVDFIKWMCSKYNVLCMVEGNNFHCGAGFAQADVRDIRNVLSNRPGSPELVVIDPFLSNKKEVSSTTIRMLLNKGMVGYIPALLGRPYSIDVRNVIPCIYETGYCYKKDNLEQLLPTNGTYRVILADKAASVLNPDPNGIDTKAVISSSCLVLEKQSDFIPDRIYFL